MGTSNSKGTTYYNTSDESDSDIDPEDYHSVDEISDTQNAFNNDTTADAAVGQRVSLPTAQDCVTVDKVNELENELDMEEIISLLYLLVEDQKEIEYHLQSMMLLMQGSNKRCLKEWAEIHSNRDSNWQNKLIEAICIIKNYRILKELGYEKSAAINQYLPNQVQPLYINKLRKVLYLVCDNLSDVETSQFLEAMRQKFNQRGVPFDEYGEDYLEVYFLKFESIKELDLKEIKSVLKVIGQESLCNKLESILPEESPEVCNLRISEPQLDNERPSTSSSSVSADYRPEFSWNQHSPKRTRKPSSVTSFDNQKQGGPYDNSGKMSLPSWHNADLQEIVENPFMPYQHELIQRQTPTKDKTKKLNGRMMRNLEDCYDIDPNKPGIVLIINQAHFYTEIEEECKHLLPKGDLKLEYRGGTACDKEALVKIFEGFGFTVKVKNDLPHLEVLKVIEETCNEITEESSLFVCILSHGDTGVVYGSNSCAVRVNTIKKIMSGTNTANLEGKPKILILQSCQGQLCQKLESHTTDSDSSYTTDGPTISYRDMLTFWATVPGYAAIRNKKKGSWFIQTLCEAMKDHYVDDHFVDICTRVNLAVQNKIWDKGEEGKNQMTPLLEQTMGKRFYLPYLHLDN